MRGLKIAFMGSIIELSCDGSIYTTLLKTKEKTRPGFLAASTS
jgi:hypothetical protein